MASRKGGGGWVLLAVPLVLLAMTSLMLGRIVTHSLFHSEERRVDDEWMWQPVLERASDDVSDMSEGDRREMKDDEMVWKIPERTVTNPSTTAHPTVQPAPINASDHELQYLIVGHEWQVNATDHPATVTLNQAFSASWWASKELFLQWESVEVNSASPEGASFELFLAHDGRVRQAVDWLDFSVEHMSKWWKIMRGGQDVDTVVNIFQRYVQSRAPYANATTGNPAESTIAVIASLPYDRDDLTVWSLAATISSLLTHGFGRVVVSGRRAERDGQYAKLVLEALQHVADHFPGSHAKLHFCPCYDEATGDQYTGYNIPKSSLKKLRHAFLGKLGRSETKCWLGADQTAWEYVYLTEPDIMLVTRPGSLRAFGEMLDEGYVVAPHRLQPIPHGSDFDMPTANDTRYVIPAEGRFRQVTELNSSTISCCDDPKSGGSDPFWWIQGFSQMLANQSTPVEVAHEKILGYPLMRLTDHTTVVFCGTEHARRCRPQPSIGCRNAQ